MAEVRKAVQRQAGEEHQAQTDGFHLVIDALKLNGVDTIYGLPGIPITDLSAPGAGRGHARHLVSPRAARGQRRGGRRLPRRQKPGICLTVSAPGLPQRPHGAGQCHHQLLPDDPDQRLDGSARSSTCSRATTRRWTSWPSPSRCARPPSACCMPQDIGVGIARAIRAAAVGPPGGVYLDLPAKLLGADHGRRGGRQGLADQGGRSGTAPDPAPDADRPCARPAQERQAPADPAGQGRRLRPGRCRHPRAGREDRHSLPADVDGQGPAARHPSAIGRGRALVRAAGSRRGAAGRRAA